jgi:hypothetical protein
VFPQLGIRDLFDLDVGFGDILEPTRPADTFGCFYFITRDHPDFDACAFECLNCLFEVLLELILDACNS